MAASTEHAAPRATYRLQFSQEFTFDDAARLVPYLAELGISHVYASPYMAARTGSEHGYDITDHNGLNPELGGQAGFDRFVGSLEAHGLGHILDFVPNHMGIGHGDNPWWLDVLEWGRNSPYAGYFDIDWDPAKPELRGKVLLPLLGDHYGNVLEAGELRLHFERETGSFHVAYHEHRFPIAPRYYPTILDRALALLNGSSASASDLRILADGFRALPGGHLSGPRRRAVRERAETLKESLRALVQASGTVQRKIEKAVDAMNGMPGEPGGFTALHRLLQRQAYRLAYWRVAADEINYRRFFDINELAGLRIEQPELFDIVHDLVLRLIGAGKLQGLRIDHIDGLFDPAGYCRRLHDRIRAPADGKSAYLVVEKILGTDESLPPDWPVDGTTGYEFMNEAAGLFVDPQGRRPLDRLYKRFTGSRDPFDRVVHDSKMHVMSHLLGSELQVLANELDRMAESNWRTRDFTLNTLKQALAEVVAYFPVYRTYVTRRGASSEDRARIDRTVAKARRASSLAPEVFDFLGSVLRADTASHPVSGIGRERIVRFAGKVQQFTAPVMAKGFEDTALYRYNRFIALNEVGSDPERFGVPVAAFHEFNRRRAEATPDSMITTMTHDAKRGEDARARLCVLSEVPQEWADRVRRWRRMNRGAKETVSGVRVPVPDDEYLLYQTLIGSWPIELSGETPLDAAALEDYRGRIRAFMTKSLREAKRRTSWAQPDETYENAVGRFVDRILDSDSGARFLADFLPFQSFIAGRGMVNGLSQTLLRLTVPGVPDLYQGSELWDLRLVDPDNRRPVDFTKRSDLLAALRGRFDTVEANGAAGVREMLENWRDGRIKLYLIWKMLKLRRRDDSLFARGGYIPLGSFGSAAENICAFVRTDGERSLIVAVPRLGLRLSSSPDPPPWSADWGDTKIQVPPLGGKRRFRNHLTGEQITADPDASDGLLLSATDMFATLPVAVLLPTD